MKKSREKQMKKIICATEINMNLCVDYFVKTRMINHVDSVEFMNNIVIVNMLDGTGYWFEVDG